MPGSEVYQWNIHELKVGSDPFLGEGSYGLVLKAYKDHVGVVAVKMTKSTSKDDIKTFVRESEGLFRVQSCKNIINVLGWVNLHGRMIGIVMEYAEHGNLANLLQNRRIIIDPEVKNRFIHEFARGLNFLHHVRIDQRLLHLDIKPCNLLLDSDLHLKFCDLGGSVLSTVTGSELHRRTDPTHGTLVYCAPERIQDPNVINSRVDIYSFGISCWEILTRKKTFESYTNLTSELFLRHLREGRRPEISQQNISECPKLFHLVKHCWPSLPSSRLDTGRIVTFLENECPINERIVVREVSSILQSLLDYNGTDPLTKERATTTLPEHIFSLPGYFGPSPGNIHQHPITRAGLYDQGRAPTSYPGAYNHAVNRGSAEVSFTHQGSVPRATVQQSHQPIYYPRSRHSSHSNPQDFQNQLLPAPQLYDPMPNHSAPRQIPQTQPYYVQHQSLPPLLSSSIYSNNAANQYNLQPSPPFSPSSSNVFASPTPPTASSRLLTHQGNPFSQSSVSQSFPPPVSQFPVGSEITGNALSQGFAQSNLPNTSNQTIEVPQPFAHQIGVSQGAVASLSTHASSHTGHNSFGRSNDLPSTSNRPKSGLTGVLQLGGMFARQALRNPFQIVQNPQSVFETANKGIEQAQQKTEEREELLIVVMGDSSADEVHSAFKTLLHKRTKKDPYTYSLDKNPSNLSTPFDAAVLCFTSNNVRSFECIKSKYLVKLRRRSQHAAKMVVMKVHNSNYSFLKDSRKYVDEGQGQDLASEIRGKFYSYKSGKLKKAEDLFELVREMAIEAHEEL